MEKEKVIEKNETIVNSEDEKRVVFVYRYIWVRKDNPNMCVKILCGLPSEHYQFMAMLKTTPEVVKASRVYMHEYDFEKVEEYEIVKKEKKENDEIPQ